MFLYSLDGLHHQIQEHPLYPSDNRSGAQDKFIDSCNWVIHSIYSYQNNRDLSRNSFAPLYSGLLDQVIGRNKTRKGKVFALLQDLDIMQVNHTYRYASKAEKMEGKYGESKKYGFTDTAQQMSLVKVGVIDKAMQRRIEKARAEQMKYYTAHPLHQKVIFNLQELTVSREDVESALLSKFTDFETVNHIRAVEDDKQHPDRERIIKALSQSDKMLMLAGCRERKNFQAWNTIADYTQSRTVGRVFHHVTNQFRELRYKLKREGLPLAEVDMKSAQITLLAIEFQRTRATYIETYRNKRKRGERKREGISGTGLYRAILSDTLNGEFYSTIASYLRSMAMPEGDLYLTNRKEFKRQLLSRALFIGGDTFNNLPLENISVYERAMLEVYPEFTEWLRANKAEHGYKWASHTAQRMESKLFIDSVYGANGLDTWSVPVHDSLLVMQEDAERVRSFLIHKLAELYGVQATDRTFSITYHK